MNALLIATPEAPPQKISVDEYMTIEPVAELKRQFYNGELFEMPGASLNHNLIAENLSIFLGICLRNKGFFSFRSDLRVKYTDDAEKLFAYPDFMVTKGKPTMEVKGAFDVAINPVVLIEILSYSTLNFDLQVKTRLYRNIESAELCIFISQYEKVVDVYRKTQDNVWTITSLTQPEAKIDVLGCEITLNQIYDQIDFA